MDRRTFLGASALALLGSAAFAEDEDPMFEEKHSVGSRKRLSPMGRKHLLSTQGANPRSRDKVNNWGEAFTHMRSAGFQNDLQRFAAVIPPEFREKYTGGIIPAFNGLVKQAVDCGFPHRPGVPKELYRVFKNLNVPVGYEYLGVTFGANGKVLANVERREKKDKKGNPIKFMVYRCWLKGVEIKCYEHDGKRTRVLVDSAIDLMVNCRNAGLGQTEWWTETVQYIPIVKPEKEIVPEVVEVTEVYETNKTYNENNAKAIASGTATAKAEVGDVIVYAPAQQLPPMGYQRPGQMTSHAWQYSLGTFGVQGIQKAPYVNVRQQQQQFQTQTQKQYMDFIQEITNINQNLVQLVLANSNA